MVNVSRFPLLAHASAEAVVAYRDGKAVTVAGFLADAAQLAALFPPGRHVLNMCGDRYRFAVGLAAALLSERISLLPSSVVADTLKQLREFAPDMFCLCDGTRPDGDLPCLDYPEAEAAMPARIEIPQLDGDRPVAWLFTSGTTGAPVPHLRTWGSLVQNVRAEAARLGLVASAAQTIVGTVPAQHSYGFESTVLVAWQSGAAFSAGKPFYPADICAALAAVPRPRLLVSTPYHLRLLLDAGVEVPPVDLVLSATAPLSDSLLHAVEARLQGPLFEIYGSTDSGQIASRRPAQGPEWQLFPGVRLEIRDGATWAGGGHVGAPVMLNDVVEITGDDRFLLLGRNTDLINIVGKRSSLAYLNHQLCAVPGVVDGSFFMPDEESPDHVTRLAALVVTRDLDAAGLMRELRSRIDAVFLPRPLIFVDALPRNDTGKLPRDAIKAVIAAHAKAAARGGQRGGQGGGR
jgi:acyl-coenzyme A synthetase/AMP-(fatty) acid ligase